jgi:hypothetical protein
LKESFVFTQAEYETLIATPEKIDAAIAKLDAERKKLLSLRRASRTIHGGEDTPEATTNESAGS